MTRKNNAERQEAIGRLREWLKPGDTVYTILRHVSRSGMQREIGIVLLNDGTDLHPNYATAQALGLRLGKRDGVIVGGCGMDMGFHVVSSLSRVLFPHGFGCIGESCPSNDHSNGDRDRSAHNPEPHAHTMECFAGDARGLFYKPIRADGLDRNKTRFNDRPGERLTPVVYPALTSICPKPEHHQLPTTGNAWEGEGIDWRKAHDFYRDTPRACQVKGCHWHTAGDYALRHRWL